MRSTGIERRSLLRLFAGGALLPLATAPLRAAGAIYLSARAGETAGSFRVAGFSPSGARAFDLPTPARGHSFAVAPARRVAVHFARRPGAFALEIDLARGIVSTEFFAPENRHFYGHGAFSRDGRLLYATENDFEGERGVIGVYDAADGYRRVGELASHGAGPHDIRLLSDGDTLVVANGGILTRPDLPRVKLNLPTMAPSLCCIDRRDGALLRKFRLGNALRQLSIRHLAVSGNDTVAVAMQYEGPANDVVPLVALLEPGAESLRPLGGPAKALRAMKQYCGSVAFDKSGRTIAASAPRGNLVTFWNADTGRYAAAARVADGSGVAPSDMEGRIVASSGRGGAFAIDPGSGAARPLDGDFVKNSRWDNHLVAAAGA